MLKFLKKSCRCQLCSINRERRFCLRRNKDICWHCCNRMRVDLRCPEECFFKVQKKPNERNRFYLTANSYSISETVELMNLNFDKWMLEDFLETNQTPYSLLENKEGRVQIENFLKDFITKLPDETAFYIKNKIKSDIIIKEKEPVPEVMVKKFLDNVVSLDFAVACNYLLSIKIKDILPTIDRIDILKKNTNILSENSTLKIIKNYDIIETALAENKETLCVTVEINRKQLITFIIKKVQEIWGIESIYFCEIKDYQNLIGLEKTVVKLISESRTDSAKQNLDLLKNKTVLSPSLLYHTASINLLEKKLDLALENFKKSYCLMPNHFNSLLSLINVYVELNDLDNAKEAIHTASLISPENSMLCFFSARIDLQENKVESAINKLNNCIKKDPDFTIAKKYLHKISNEK